MQKMMILAAAVIVAAGLNWALPVRAAAGEFAGVQVAVTVDDLPGETRPDGLTRRNAIDLIISAVKRNAPAGAYGFVTDSNLEGSAEDGAVLNDWIEAGLSLGNHSFSHKHFNSMPAEQYIADIKREDDSLAARTAAEPVAVRRVFRFPYLDEGDTLAKRDQARDFLARDGYAIAQVTLNYDDWAWEGAYVNCKKSDDLKQLAWLQAHILEAADESLRSSRALAKNLFGKDIPYVLLSHITTFSALHLDEILAHWRAQGVAFVALKDALADPAYTINPNFPDECENCPGDHGRPFLEQIAKSRGLNPAKFKKAEYAWPRIWAICAPSPKR